MGETTQPNTTARTTSFVHLRVHSQYSLLRGMLRTKDIVALAKKYAMPAVGLTDSNNLFGAIDFALSLKDAGIKPILGCELYLAPETVSAFRQAAANPQPSQQYRLKHYHLPVYCKDYQGYQSLCALLTRANEEVAKGSPVALIDFFALESRKEGLLVLSGGLKGEIAHQILLGHESQALEAAERYRKTFGDDFYLELVDNGLPEQDKVNETLYAWHQKKGFKIVGTADVHYPNPDDQESHEVLQCIEVGRNLDLDRPKTLVPNEFYFKSPETMLERFARFEGAAAATLEIAEKCDLKFKFKDEQGRPIYHLPNYRPAGVEKSAAFDLLEYFCAQSRTGLRERFESPSFAEKTAAPDWSAKRKQYEERLEGELEMIAKTGFAGYFLIVADFINWAKQREIPVGPGRGSGAGSLVAYALRITDIDPIEYHLLFERFINPERISMPDFDVDFCQDRRGEVIQYVIEKYGKENVSQIITFGKLQTRACIKDVGRVFGLTFQETDMLTKLVPDELGISLKDAIQKEPLLQEKISSDPKIGKVFEVALKLEGMYRNVGMHAAGVIITENPIVSYCPLYMTEDGDVVTQYDKDFAEKIGLVKYDFLGLKTLTVIANAVRTIRSQAPEGSPDRAFDLEKISLKDPKVYALISSGDTDGVFQVESAGMKDLCTRLQPNSIEDLTAINALFRPGPLGSGMVDDFIDRKHGRKQVAYELPQLETILKDTYGVILYQEQVMQIARELAGYSLGQADMLRRAMGKKKPEEMAKHKEIFVKGAVGLGIDGKRAEAIFDLMAKFAEYGFNKSHSAAYAFITYQTAYLKTHYPVEFMAALMTTEMSQTDKLSKYINDARAHDITVLPPDVNVSETKFSVQMHEGKKAVRFALEAIKGVGSNAVAAILEARATGGPFQSVLDFCKRVSTRKANKKVLESLILAGAFGGIAEANRPSLLASVDALLEFGSDEQEEKALGQTSLFDAFTADDIKLVQPTATIIKQEAEWPKARMLLQEKAVLGFFVSGHPFDHWQRICEDWLHMSVEKLKALPPPKWSTPQQQPNGAPGGGWQGRPKRKEVQIGGLFTSIREITSKKGRMAIAQFEDLTGQIEVVFFADAYAQWQEKLKQAMGEAEPVVLTAEIDYRGDQPQLLVQSFDWIAEVHKNRVHRVVLKLNPAETTVDQLRLLQRKMFENRGKCPVTLEFDEPLFRVQMELPKTLRVAASPAWVADVNRIFKKSVVQLKQ